MATNAQSAEAGVTLIWERAEPPARGAVPGPTPDQITAAAFEIADHEGLHAVSVKRVASRLRTPVARLDGYLSSREDLLDLMLDAAFAEIDPPERDVDASWRERLADMAHATQQTARRHPWLRMLAGTRTPCGPHGLRHSERALAALAGLGLDAATMAQAVNTVLAFVYGYVQLELLEPGRQENEAAEAARRTRTAHYLIEQMSSGQYPTLAQVFADASSLNAEDAFETGLALVLDGIAVRLGLNASAAAPAPEGAPEAAEAEGQPATVAAAENAAVQDSPGSDAAARRPRRSNRRR